MNIFVLDLDHEQCAQYHVDRHCVKMILEYAQILSTAVRSCGIDKGYKATHQNHPCNLWARESLSNWLWLTHLVFALNNEWRYRYCHNHDHKSLIVVESLPQPPIEDKGITPFALAMPNNARRDDPVDSYRTYYNLYKKDLFSWKRRDPPYWIQV